MLPGHREMTTDTGEVVFQYLNATYRGSEKVDQVQVFKKFEPTERKTKVVCTIGPANNSVETLVEMLDAGMSVARVNFTNSDENREELKNLREAMVSRPDRQYAILLDLQGPMNAMNSDISPLTGQAITEVKEEFANPGLKHQVDFIVAAPKVKNSKDV
jgi:hypothetical protein